MSGRASYAFKLPLIRSLLDSMRIRRAGALYAEQLAAELGVYDEILFGRLGYLQSIAFSRCPARRR